MLRAPSVTVAGFAELEALAGDDLPATEWLQLERHHHACFDEAVQHRPSTHYPGTEAAAALHGAHTLALIPMLFDRTVAVHGFVGLVLYGFDRVRLPAAVPIGSHVRARFRVVEVTPAGGGAQCRVAATIEAEGGERPACVAELLVRFLG